MNDLADDEKPAILENLPGRVGEIDGALDSVAETELLCQAHRDVAATQNPSGAPDLVHDVASIMRFDLLLHRRHYFGRPQVDLLAGGGAAGNQIGAHGALEKKSAAAKRAL